MQPHFTSLRAGPSLPLSLVATFCLTLAACGGTRETDLPENEDVLEPGELGETQAELTTLAFTPVVDPKGFGKRTETKAQVVLTSATAYASYFGHTAPPAIEFAMGDVAVFHSAGTFPTGGHVAEVTGVSISASGKLLVVETRHTSPGPNCVTPQVLEQVGTLVKARLSTKPQRAVFDEEALTLECGETSACALVDCMPGMICEERPLPCLVAPCPTEGVCVCDPALLGPCPPNTRPSADNCSCEPVPPTPSCGPGTAFYEPGCGGGTLLPVAGCYASCQADSDCSNGTTCASVHINPCAGKTCLACGAAANLCVPRTP